MSEATDMRASFEAVVKSIGIVAIFERHEDGLYTWTLLQYLWAIWQARQQEIDKINLNLTEALQRLNSSMDENSRLGVKEDTLNQALDLMGIKHYHSSSLCGNIAAIKAILKRCESKNAALKAKLADPKVWKELSDGELIDKHLDAVLRASGSGLRYYSMTKTIDDMRQAMRLAIAAGVAEFVERLAK